MQLKLRAPHLISPVDRVAPAPRNDLLSPIIQGRVGLPEKRRADRIMEHDLLQSLAGDRIP